MDPILFSMDLGFMELTVRWYGVLVVGGVLAAAFYAAWYVRRQNQDPNIIWDMMIWLLIAGIIGARIWYVLNDMIGGGTRYIDDPVSILYIHQGGLNILGGVVLGAVVGWYYCKRNDIDFWLIADAIGPGYLIGQAVGRLGNYINQELYGPPTDLPWGISIDAGQRIAPYNDLTRFPVETTLFHPTFAYEMIWNVLAAGVIIYLIVRQGDKLKTGAVAALTLIAAGVGRTLIETNFRPDQPPFFGLPISTSMVLSILFGAFGVFLLLVRMGRISVPFIKAGDDEYYKKEVRRAPTTRRPHRKKA